MSRLRAPAFLPIMLARDLTPMHAWNSLRETIVSAGQEVDCCTLVDWLRVAIARGDVDQRSILSEQDPTTPLADSNLLLHHHKILIQDLPRINLALDYAQGTLILANISELVLE